MCCGVSLLIPPKILFLDEISNGVDPMSRKNLYSYLRTLKDTACFLITHKIDEAEKICDRIGIIVEGQIRELAHPSELKESHGIICMLSVTPVIQNGQREESYRYVDQTIQNRMAFCKPLNRWEERKSYQPDNVDEDN